MITTTYKPEENIIYLERTGEINAQDLLELVEQVNSNFQDLDHVLILDNVGNSVSRFHYTDYELIAGAIRNVAKNFMEIRQALVIDTPENTVLGILFEKMGNQIESYSVKVFSTFAAAKSWLQN